MESKGYLKIKTFTASEAFPVNNATIRIYSTEEQNGGIDYSIKTDRTGITEIIELPAPSLSLSLTPNPSEKPYSTYNIEIYADGYYPKTLVDITIFQDILSLISVELIPNAGLIRDIPTPLSSNL